LGTCATAVNVLIIGIGSGIQIVVLINCSSLILALFLQNQTRFVGAISRMVLSFFLARVLNRRRDLVSRHSCSSCKCISGPLLIRRTKVQGGSDFFRNSCDRVKCHDYFQR
jgi:hypothetical protein